MGRHRPRRSRVRHLWGDFADAVAAAREALSGHPAALRDDGDPAASQRPGAGVRDNITIDAAPHRCADVSAKGRPARTGRASAPAGMGDP